MKAPMWKEICGVKCRRVTTKTYDNLIGWGPYHRSGEFATDSMSRLHYRPDDRMFRPRCFPELLVEAKDELWKRIERLTHHTTCGDRESKVVCALLDKDGLYWKAPSHKVGQCPFCHYR